MGVKALRVVCESTAKLSVVDSVFLRLLSFYRFVHPGLEMAPAKTEGPEGRVMHAFIKGFTTPSIWEMFGCWTAGIIGLGIMVALIGFPFWFFVIRERPKAAEK